MRRFWFAVAVVLGAAWGVWAAEFDVRLAYSSGVAGEIEPCG